MKIRIKRVYDDPSPDDGYRVLIDRLWPRGVAKARAAVAQWAKAVTPSDELRRWFHADREGRYPEFCERYRAELDASDAVDGFARDLAGQPAVTFVTAAHTERPTHADVLRDYVNDLLSKEN